MRITFSMLFFAILTGSTILNATPTITNSVVLCATQTSCETLASSHDPIDGMWMRGTGQDQITVEGFATTELTNDSFRIKTRSKYTTGGFTEDWAQINAASQIQFDVVFGPDVTSFAPVFNITGVTGPAALGNMVVFYNDGVHGLQTDSEWFPNSRLVTLGPLPVKPGVPIFMTFAFSATTFPGAAALPLGLTTDEADYSHTVDLRGFLLYNSAGQSIAANVASPDGINIAVLAPEPGYAAAVGAALALIAAVRWRVALRSRKN